MWSKFREFGKEGGFAPGHCISLDRVLVFCIQFFLVGKSVIT